MKKEVKRSVEVSKRGLGRGKEGEIKRGKGPQFKSSAKDARQLE